MAEPLRLVIVEDERAARERIRRVLGARAPDVEIVGLCSSGAEAVEAIRTERPDIVLLDVQMHGMNGLDVVRAIGAARMPFTIFVTAHERFAVEAFDVSAVDYVLKPFTDERLLVALERARQRFRERQAGSLDALLQHAAAAARPEPGATPPEGDGTPLERLVTRRHGRSLLIPAEQVDWIDAAGPYAELHCGVERHLVRLSMAELEARLDRRRFVRIHRSTIVNITRVAALEDYLRGEYFVILHDGTRLRLSRSRRVRFEQLLGQRL